ncbi:ATP-binding protein [Pleionea sediminis]|uniref:ATP-binding protein n=1 Tax=Pleionea sediminis TaxID=2569479 RepID=UPI0013DE7979|nr:ATP-binding protein [Pleionea sediminis]
MNIGIPRNQLDAIFIPFHQLENAITKAEGSGLGLAICQRLIKLMNSNLHVKSKLGQGSQFWFDLDLPLAFEQSSDTISAVHKSELSKESKPIKFPDKELLEQLKEQAKRHNILGIHEVLKEIESDPDLNYFYSNVKPFVENYRFKPLLKWLEDNQP